MDIEGVSFSSMMEVEGKLFADIEHVTDMSSVEIKAMLEAANAIRGLLSQPMLRFF